MATSKQIDLFNRLVGERQLPPEVQREDLKYKFAQLPDRTASAWIERILALPQVGEEDSGPIPF